MSSHKYLHTTDSVTVVLLDRPYTVSNAHPRYSEIMRALIGGADPNTLLEIINSEGKRVMDLINKSVRGRNLTGVLTYDEGVILYNGAPLFNAAAEKLCQLIMMGHDAGALSKFVENQQLNPDQKVIDNLYQFLEYGNIPLTMDGHFLAYKAVRADYKDCRSGVFLNSVGQTVSMDRDDVDRDRDNTCSRGLHICSYAYLPHFSRGGHVMICKVHPRDVVAIPTDYNNTKMRVCSYTVVGEVTSYYQRDEDVLSRDRLAEERWEVRYNEQDNSDELYDTYYTKDEAIAQALALKEDSLTPINTWVKDNRTDKEIPV